jgi:transposase
LCAAVARWLSRNISRLLICLIRLTEIERSKSGGTSSFAWQQRNHSTGKHDDLEPIPVGIKSVLWVSNPVFLMEDIMGMVKEDDGWRLPDELWEQMAPLLPPRKPHPLGCHNPRVPDRAAMNAIFFVLRTGCQWNALNATGICSSTSAYRRFREWLDAGVFEEFWRLGLLAADALEEIDWAWLSLDGAMTKAPLGGEKNRPQSYRSRQRRGQAQLAH